MCGLTADAPEITRGTMQSRLTYSHVAMTARVAPLHVAGRMSAFREERMASLHNCSNNQKGNINQQPNQPYFQHQHRSGIRGTSDESLLTNIEHTSPFPR